MNRARVRTVTGSAKVDIYDRWAVHAAEEMVAIEHAMVWAEVEAKAADQAWGSLPRHIDPHHLTNARHQLPSRGVIVPDVGATRGGRAIEVLISAAGPKRATQTAIGANASSMPAISDGRWGPSVTPAAS